MATLSNVRLETFTILKWIGLLLTVVLGIFILFKLFFFVKNVISPTKAKPPAASFGKLPTPDFPQEDGGHFSYSIDTVSGDLPDFPDRAKVYKTISPAPNLLAVKNASDKVAELGFTNPPQQLSDSLYRWSTNEPIQKSLVLNVNMAQENLTSDFTNEPNILTSNNFPTATDAVQIAKNYLNNLGVFPSDIDDGKTKVDLFRLDNGAVFPAQSISNAQFFTVYLFQKSLGGLPIVYPGGNKSTMSVTLSGGANEPQIIDSRFFYQNVSDHSSDYSIKTAKEAYDELGKKGGYIATVDPNTSNVAIKKVYLALYASSNEQKYLEPVVVFEGNHNFTAYVPAVKDVSIGK